MTNFAYALVADWMDNRIQNPGLSKAWAYWDDTTVIGTVNSIDTALNFLVHSRREHGLSINYSKSTVICPQSKPESFKQARILLEKYGIE